MTLPTEGLSLDTNSVLVFAMADGGETMQAIDLTVALTDDAGKTAQIPLSAFAPIQPSIQAMLFKSPIGNIESEQVLQSFEFPLLAFADENPDFNPTALRTIRFVFDKTETGTVILDNVGFRQES